MADPVGARGTRPPQGSNSLIIVLSIPYGVGTPLGIPGSATEDYTHLQKFNL